MIRELIAALALLTASARQDAPYVVSPGLFDASRPDLGLTPAPGTETFTVFAPDETGHRFSNGVVLIGFKGRLYAQWQAAARDEDASDTHVMFSVSDDGEHWSAPRVLVPAGAGGVMVSSGGWKTDGKTLIAFVNVWPTGFQSGDGGHAEYLASSDGLVWSERSVVLGADGRGIEGVIEQDPHDIDGRVIGAFHMRPGMTATPAWTDDPLAVSGWSLGRMEHLPRAAPVEGAAAHEARLSREIEPSLFRQSDCVVMVFRDEDLSFHQLAARSCDRGQTWSTPVVTAMPDSRAKQSAGNLPDGTAYLVNAPNTDRLRIPLTVTLSADGRTFDRSFLLRGQGDLQPLRYEGEYKRPGYHYPKSIVWNGFLYVGYSANKEDVQVTRVPLASIRVILRTVIN
ncbi:hypothetical protein BH09PSE1_BH09PSE1_25640 [soil metagenome]